VSTAEGDIEVENGVLIIRRIRVHYTLAGCPEDKREAARPSRVEMPGAPEHRHLHRHEHRTSLHLGQA